jgi:hypothetical protein
MDQGKGRRAATLFESARRLRTVAALDFDPHEVAGAITRALVIDPADRVGRRTLCAEDSGLVVDADDTTEKFFEADGSPSAALKAMIEFLQQDEQNRPLTDLAVAALAKAGLIEPWPLTVKIRDQPGIARAGSFSDPGCVKTQCP